MLKLKQNQTAQRHLRSAIAGAVIMAAGLIAAPTSFADGPYASEQAGFCAHIAMDGVKMTIVETALTFDLEPEMALAVADVASGFDDGKVGKSGAVGVMQLDPVDVADLYRADPHILAVTDVNVSVGVRYLKQLYAFYGNRWDLALAHFAGGPLTDTASNGELGEAEHRFVQKVFEVRADYQQDPATQCYIKYRYTDFVLAGGETIHIRPETGSMHSQATERPNTRQPVSQYPEYAPDAQVFSLSSSTTYPYGYDNRQLALKQRFESSRQNHADRKAAMRRAAVQRGYN